jgi:D-methionine transport system ATP-binding protein
MPEMEEKVLIIFENVSKSFESYGKTVEAVKNVNLQMEEGKIHGIIGFSGAGKSTLVRLINLLERPTAGKVILGDTEITSLSEKKLREERKKIGMIFQQFNLFSSRNVYENVAYPLKYSGMKKKEIQDKVNYLLQLVDLQDKTLSYPSQLSGGQKQRVAIARALAYDPKILLSDESTSALDPQTTKSILKLLKQLNEKLGITIVVITHEMQVVKEICDNVVVMENGEVVEQGDVFNVFANPVKQITKDFVDSTSNLSKIHELIKDKVSITELKEGECILKFTYLERNASEALVSQISRNYNLDVNIIFGNIELIGEHPIGGLVSVVSGDAKNITDAIEYLRKKNVGVEVILDARVSK